MPILIVFFFISVSTLIAQDAAFIVNQQNARDKIRVKKYEILNKEIKFKPCNSDEEQIVSLTEYKVIPSESACQYNDFITELEKGINIKKSNLDILEVCATSKYGVTEKVFEYKGIPVSVLPGEKESFSFVGKNKKGELVFMNAKGESTLIQHWKSQNSTFCNEALIRRKLRFE